MKSQENNIFLNIRNFGWLEVNAVKTTLMSKLKKEKNDYIDLTVITRNSELETVSVKKDDIILISKTKKI